MEEERVSDVPQEDEKSESCLKYMDALAYCYSPKSQWRSYYIRGGAENCQDFYDKLMNCFKGRLPATRPKAQKSDMYHGIWELRSKSQSGAFWQQDFAEHFVHEKEEM
ncbi:hypothetical protein BSKO_10254 [Bryopsis sp. KO-2023]|nr:hypothetical protein BSKO_10254 [Bryopsis sp. KO-2023]